MRRRAPCIALLLGLGLAGLAGCKGSEVPSQSCRADEFCDDDFVCHPVAQVCVPRCFTEADCPLSASNCASLEGHETTGKFCQCQSTQVCAEEEEDTVCSATDRICAPPCRNDVDCTHGRTCDRDSGACR